MIVRIGLILVVAVGCEAKPAAKASQAQPTAGSSEGPSAPPAPSPTMETDAVAGFAGFSTDGRSFAWVVASPMVPDLVKMQIVSVGETHGINEFVDTPDGKAKGKEKLLQGGFTSTKRPVPSGVTFEANLTAKPPTFALVRAGTRSPVAIGEYPYPPTDVAELWGVSGDGTHVAIHIHGKDVPGLLSKGEGGTFHFFFVAPVP